MFSLYRAPLCIGNKGTPFRIIYLYKSRNNHPRSFLIKFQQGRAGMLLGKPNELPVDYEEGTVDKCSSFDAYVS